MLHNSHTTVSPVSGQPDTFGKTHEPESAERRPAGSTEPNPHTAFGCRTQLAGVISYALLHDM
jgi:hypothetical protein